MDEFSQTQHTPVDLPKGQQPILLVFSDDSTLFFARLMRDLLKSAAPDCPVAFCLYSDENTLSERQITTLLPEGPDLVLDRKGLHAVFENRNIRAIVTSRVYAPLRNALKDMDKAGQGRLRAGRPCLISFLGGLDFFPERGLRHRLVSDAVFVFPRPDIKLFKEIRRQSGGVGFWQHVGFGHPAALAPKAPPADLHSRKDIYFFAQAISPKSRAGRRHILDALIAIAERNPERDVYIKLRHLPGENAQHLHVEKYDYPSLLKKYSDVPPNLKLTACVMQEALEKAAIAITCTSTAALDAMSEGVPTMIYLDYVDNFLDPLNGPMREVFKTSGAIVTLEELLFLKTRPVNPAWVADMFAERSLGADVLKAIEAFEGREGQYGAQYDALYDTEAVHDTEVDAVSGDGS